MHSTAAQSAIATKPPKFKYPLVQTPQRKARYSDRNRWYLKPLKASVLLQTGCRSAREIKKYLKKLGANLDLRLTAAWKAIKFELEEKIIALRAANGEEHESSFVLVNDSDRLHIALNQGIIANFKEDEIGDIFWVWSKTGDRELVTSSNLCKFLRQIAA